MTRSSRVGALPSDLGPLIESFNDLKERIERLEAPSGETAAATLPRTNANVAELLARRTLNSEDTAYILTVDTLPYTSPELTPIPFTLTERRRIHFQASCYAGMIAFSSGSGSAIDPWVEVILSLNVRTVDGPVGAPNSHALSAGAGFNAGQRALARISGREFIEDYWTLNPGDYTAYAQLEVNRLDGTGSYVRLAYPKASVEILEKA